MRRTWLDTAIDRRSLLLGSFALCGLPILGGRTVAASALRLTSDPFSLGVASGDPSPDGMVLWTRLAPDPLNGGGMPNAEVEVGWELATDERFRRIIRRGRTMALPEWGHSVHVEVDGLAPDRWFWYRFRVAGDVSPAGRTRTLPAPGADVTRLRFAFASCQHFETGLFTAYSHMSREDLDLVFFLGDYIYEGPGRDQQVRKHTGPELMTVADYRNRLAKSFCCGGLRRIRPTTNICRCVAPRCRVARTCLCTAASPGVRWPRRLSSTPGSTAPTSPATTAQRRRAQPRSIPPRR